MSFGNGIGENCYFRNLWLIYFTVVIIAFFRFELKYLLKKNYYYIFLWIIRFHGWNSSALSFNTVGIIKIGKHDNYEGKEGLGVGRHQFDTDRQSRDPDTLPEERDEYYLKLQVIHVSHKHSRRRMPVFFSPPLTWWSLGIPLEVSN